MERFGGHQHVTLWDLSRESKEGDGDVGICFEWAVHDGIARRDPLIYPLVSEVLEDYCKIKGGAESLLFGPEKNGRVPVLASVEDALTPDSRVYVGRVGQPPKLKTHLPKIIRAFYRQADRDKLPTSINGLWKADLFVGNKLEDAWVGTTVKIKGTALEAAPGLRIGIYPKKDKSESPRFDTGLNLVRLPLPYRGDFMETFYKSFWLVKAFLKFDATCPPVESAHLADEEDRFIASELQQRRNLPVLAVIEWLRTVGQRSLVTESIASEAASMDLTEGGIESAVEAPSAFSLAPVPAEEG